MLLLILAFGAVAAAVTALIARFSGGRRLPKYVPALLAFAFAAYCLLRAVSPSASGWDDLIFAIMTMLVGGVAVIALLTAVAIDVMAARRARGKRLD